MSKPELERSRPAQQSESMGLALILTGLATLSGGTTYLLLLGDLRAMGWFTPHPILQLLSISALVLGITPLQPLLPPGQKAAAFKSHQKRILRLASPLMSVGVAVIWWNKYQRSAEHFTSWHAWFGLLSVLWMGVQGAMGVGMAWFGRQMFGSEGNAKRMYKFHRASGYALVLLVLLTVHLAGAHSTWSLSKGREYSALRAVVYWAAPVLVLAGLGMRTKMSKLQFK